MSRLLHPHPLPRRTRAVPPAGRRPLASVLLLAGATWLAGCTVVGPDYRRPELGLPASLQPGADALDPAAAAVPGATVPAGPGAAGARGCAAAPAANDGSGATPGATDPAAGARWWQAFGSPALDALVERSLCEHPGVSAGQAALRQAEAFVRAQQGYFAPQLSAAYSGTRQKVPGVLASPLSDSSYVFNLHTLQLDLSYTPDVFGGNQRAVEGLQAGVAQQQALLDATRLSLAANVAQAAVQEATLRAQLDALDEQLAIQRDSYMRSQALQQAGQLGQADLAVQEAALAALEAQRPPLERALGQGRDLLKALVGAWPDEVLAQRFTLEGMHLPSPLPQALPSVVVEARPDVRAAEAQLQAANAAIGVAAAARLPAITLGVNSIGESGSRIADLFRSAGSFWALAGGVTAPLFDGGTLKSREEAARAGWEQAREQYRLTVINAFQNVADALVGLHADRGAVDTALRSEQAAARSLEIGERQYRLGDIGALALAQLRQSWLQAHSQRIVAESARLSDSVALYQALGGDLPPAAVPASGGAVSVPAGSAVGSATAAAAAH